ILACDQVSVVGRRGKAARLEAVSGSPGFDKQSRFVRALQTLAGAVMAWGGRLAFAGTRAPEWPSEVEAALDAYLSESNSHALLIIPLEDARDKNQGKP